VGGARTALFNQLFARSQGGVFVLRIEDTDTERSSDASTHAIFDALRWLGLQWDEGPGVGGAHGPYFQSERADFYRDALRQLEAAGAAYPAYETPEELDAMREAQTQRGGSPRYDGRARDLTAAERASLEAAGRRPAWRFRLPAAGETAWDDIVRGRIAFQNDVLDDFVLMRSDGLPTYNFACVVDDLAMRISHVVRGDDHISNTPRQLLVYAALGATPPRFAHASMILGPDGKRLSKRHGATSVEAFGDLGIVPEAMINFLALLGWALDGKTELFTLAELERVFTLERVGANPAVFDTAKLEWLNAQHLKRLTEPDRIARVAAFLRMRGHDLTTKSAEWQREFVHALGDRLKTLADAESVGGFALTDTLSWDPEAWSGLLQRPQAGTLLGALADALAADEAFSLASIEAATRTLASTRGVKFGELVAPARIALTGRTSSPGIFEVVHLLGRERTVARLRAAAERWAAEAPAATG